MDTYKSADDYNQRFAYMNDMWNQFSGFASADSANLKTDGIYERIRHPSYLGIHFIILGFSFTMNSLYSFLVLFVPVLLSVMYRIRIEEKVLVNEFGERYSNYASRTKKLIPGIY